ncbi:L-threonine dehydrogenase [Basidiobolus meristosporus CBS 931.73]|uniref:L-threonine 3-dehydrogenase, mitochondrial n=1 Tax=Basidiobolus meristosporus CBS 931.73 TaxID=1314790 RepID=A0A1Y1Y068_9FUNG|nr:L-threonine dehydrogenase [Basidiobolus meristosporus CBS 931.73]|eukprot:ORX91412.1 L-threonine dehydrogenase [Basidiobolus meristosporus CBS 931.73]
MIVTRNIPLIRNYRFSPRLLPSHFNTSRFYHSPQALPRGLLHRKVHTSNSIAPVPRILVTGSLGQLGSGLVRLLREKYGDENVVASDIRKPREQNLGYGPFVYADVLNYQQLESLVVDFHIDWIVHLSAILSAVGEKNPAQALAVNVNGFQNVLDLAKIHGLRIFSPSTIGVFGPSTPKDNTPDLTIQRPNTIYGITKVHMELMGEYYHEKYGVDFRSVRYPGIISADTQPGGGTTDYAVEIFHEALKTGNYQCFLSKDTALPMMYLPDCLKGTVQLLEAPSEQLTQRTYNMAAVSFTPAEIADEIRAHIPGFNVTYSPDFRQAIADSWPRSFDDSKARLDWNWKHDYDTSSMVQDMLTRLRPHYTIPKVSSVVC